MSSARDKTMEHLRELVTAVAVVGALSAEASACGGYGVVDPLPPPANCPDILKDLSGTTKREANGDWTITLHSSNSDVVFKGGPQIIAGGKIVSSNVLSNGDLEIRLTPDPGVTVRVRIPSTCSGTASIVAVVFPTTSDAGGDAGDSYSVAFEARP